MDYFFSHIGYILIGAIIVAAIAVVWAVAASKWEQQQAAEKNTEPKWDCGMGCSGCTQASACHKPEKQ